MACVWVTCLWVSSLHLQSLLELASTWAHLVMTIMLNPVRVSSLPPTISVCYVSSALYIAWFLMYNQDFFISKIVLVYFIVAL